MGIYIKIFYKSSNLIECVFIKQVVSLLKSGEIELLKVKSA